MLSYISQNVWIIYLRLEQISEDPIFVSYIPCVIGIAKKKLGKVNYVELYITECLVNVSAT